MDTINTSIDTNSVDKKKKSIFIKCIIAFTSIFSLIGVGFALLIPTTYKSAKAVDYDDEDCTIWISGYELNNYLFPHLASYFDDLGFDDAASYFTYDGDEYTTGYTYTLDRYITGFKNGNDDLIYIVVITDDVDIPVGTFRYYIDGEGYVEFAEDTILAIYFQESAYDTLKSLIEQDIQANQSNYTPTNLLQDMITLIFGGVLGVATGIGGGLSDLTNALVIQSGAMSPFIAVVLIFGGLALAFGLSRWVVNLITSLGNRNR